MDIRQILNALKNRNVSAHKGDFGKLLLLCGSKGYTGAAALAAMGSLRVGAGLVYLGVPESIYAIEAIKLNEPVVFALPDEGGMMSTKAVDAIADKIGIMDAILMGPGCGKSAGTTAVMRYVIQNFKGPIVLDADGINCMAAHNDLLRSRTAPTILTPHEGEFIRFTGTPIYDRVNAALNLAKDLGCIVVLKGHKTIVTDGEDCYVNHTGNPGMAVGGSGDVLSGIITGLLGQGVSPMDAAACGVWLHGAAGDLCATDLGQLSMLPTDMLNALPRLLK